MFLGEVRDKQGLRVNAVYASPSKATSTVSRAVCEQLKLIPLSDVIDGPPVVVAYLSTNVCLVVCCRAHSVDASERYLCCAARSLQERR
jgi:hypothetical protein